MTTTLAVSPARLWRGRSQDTEGVAAGQVATATDMAGRAGIAARDMVRPAAASPDLTQLYFAIEAARVGDRPLIVQFVGVSGGEGVTTIAAGYARRSAYEAQSAILFVDCDDRLPEPATRQPTLPELLDLFQAGRPLNGAAVPAPSETAGSEGWPVAGRNPDQGRVRHAMLGRHAMRDLNPRLLTAFADELRRSFALVVLDCPPVSRSPLAAVLARIADGTIVVAAAGRTRRRGLQVAVAEIARMGGQVSGLVLNRQRQWLPRWLRRGLV